ncbi:MAG: calcium-binding protein [Tepidisphaeraceae bacterium]
MYLSRLDASGALDTAFGQDGLVDLGQSQRDSGRPIVEVTPLQLDFFSDNTLIVNMQPATLPETSHRLIRLNTDGSLATAFGDHGMSDFIAKVPVTQMNARVDLSNGQVYVSVYSQKPGQWEYAQSARLRNDGRIDKAYGHQQVFIDYVSPGGRLFNGNTRYVFRGPATLGSGNRLFIDGTSGDDTITLRGTRVLVNGEHFQFDVPHLTSITIQDGGGGNDRIISDANVPTNVTLSVGQSFIQTGSANDSINAGHFGDGRDTIFSGSGNDSIAAGNESYVDAGAGKDSITCAGGDTVFGGSGNDRIYVYGENPRSPAHISGGGGNDTIDLANGNTAYIDGKGGNDTVIVRFLCRALFLGGSGADTLLSDNNKLSNGGDLFYDVGPADVFREDVRNLPRI